MDAKPGSRELFPHLKPVAYCNHAAISPPSRPVEQAIALASRHYATEGLGAFFPWQAQRESLRSKLSVLLNTASENIALTAGTTRGITDIALSIAWKAGDRIVVFEGEFPTNITPWQCAARVFQLELCWLLTDDFDRPLGLEKLEDLLRSGVRLVAVSAVQFQSGLRMPLEAIGMLCRQYGAELFVDAIQALGVVPLDVDNCHIDYLSAGSHKWLMGMEGAGLLYVRPEAGARLTPSVAGWLSHENGGDFLTMGEGHLRYDRPLVKEARVFEAGARNVLGFAALEASLDLLLQIGIPNIFNHVQTYHDALETPLVAHNLVSLRTSDSDFHSGILSFRAGDKTTDILLLQKHLWAQGISCATPDGVLRFAPHWPNSLEEVPVIVEAVDQFFRPEAS